MEYQVGIDIKSSNYKLYFLGVGVLWMIQPNQTSYNKWISESNILDLRSPVRG